jgi:hypothetical protein
MLEVPEVPDVPLDPLIPEGVKVSLSIYKFFLLNIIGVTIPTSILYFVLKLITT